MTEPHPVGRSGMLRAATIGAAEVGLGERLAGVAHLFMSLYLATLLLVPDVQTAFSGLCCLTAMAAILAARLRGYRAAAPPGHGRRVSGMWVLLGPALCWALIVALQMATGHSPTKVGNQLVVILCVTVVGLSWVPAWWFDSRRWLLPAASIGAIGASLLAAWQSGVQGIPRPHGWLGASAIGTGAIKFGDVAVLLALLALVLVLTAQGWRRALGLAGMAGGMTALALSQARGGMIGALIAVLALALALLLASRRRHQAARLAADTLGGGGHGSGGGQGDGHKADGHKASHGVSLRRLTTMATAGLLLFGLVGLSMHKRFADIEPQIERFQKGDADSEAGQRLALWQAAIRAGLHAPLAGVGLGGGFADDIQRQIEAGDIPASIQILYSQPHNQYLNGLSAAGIPGFLVTLALFWLPVLALVRRIGRGEDSPEARAALVVIASFAGFALTDSMFDRQITIIAFFLLSSWFLSMAGGPRPGRTPPPGA